MIQAQIYIDKDEQRGNIPLHQFIMHLLIRHKISGATSFTGFSGFGKNNRLKQPGLEFSFDDTPMLITFIDEAEKVENALHDLRQQYKGGFIVTNDYSNSLQRW